MFWYLDLGCDFTANVSKPEWTSPTLKKRSINKIKAFIVSTKNTYVLQQCRLNKHTRRNAMLHSRTIACHHLPSSAVKQPNQDMLNRSRALKIKRNPWNSCSHTVLRLRVQSRMTTFGNLRIRMLYQIYGRWNFKVDSFVIVIKGIENNNFHAPTLNCKTHSALLHISNDAAMSLSF